MTTQCHTPTVADTSGPPPDPVGEPVLRAARAAILDIGLRRTTLAEVARRAGVSRMTLYRQYGDLDAIVSALLTAEFTGLFAQVAATVKDRPSARDRLVGASVAVVAAIAEHPLYRRVLDVDPELLLPLVVDRVGSTQRIGRDIVEDLLRQGQADGSVRAGDPTVAAGVLATTLAAFVFSARTAGTARPEVQAEVGRLVEGYLAALPSDQVG